MPTIEVTTIDYRPEPPDGDNLGAYLQRASEAITAAYGYFCTLKTARDEQNNIVRQLQITIPDEGSTGNKRQVTIMAPEVIVDMNGDIMAESTFNAKFGS